MVEAALHQWLILHALGIHAGTAKFSVDEKIILHYAPASHGESSVPLPLPLKDTFKAMQY